MKTFGSSCISTNMTYEFVHKYSLITLKDRDKNMEGREREREKERDDRREDKNASKRSNDVRTVHMRIIGKGRRSSSGYDSVFTLSHSLSLSLSLSRSLTYT
jgi:hypothetical protein